MRKAGQMTIEKTHSRLHSSRTNNRNFNRFSFVDFSEKSFQPIVQSLTLLIAAGADPMVADRLGKCCGHYLAEWRYTKERVDVSRM